MSIDGKQSKQVLLKEYERLFEVLKYSMHELPAGVIWNPNAATTKQCAELLNDLYQFEALSNELGIEHDKFIQGCSWHLEHYPHYLSRQKHFSGYAQYIQERNGPLRVSA
ncbi:hypothetical protein Meth11DRAFT_0269 [Methylophilaceae bacterium 11]|nr:hypothetical protein Meth11DRAFT_0269 [Methylophilaceae bacterium 11]